MSYCLRFADESEFSQYKELLGIRIIDEEKIIPNGVDVIGTFYDVVDEIAVPLDGYHVNLMVLPDEALSQFLVYPRNPRRVFFGVPLTPKDAIVSEGEEKKIGGQTDEPAADNGLDS